MRRCIMLVGIGLAAGVFAAEAQAQVFVRAPFVRVVVGPEVQIRAPFVNLRIPTGGYYYSSPPGPTFLPPTIHYPPAPPAVVPPRAPDFEAPPPREVPGKPMPPVDPDEPAPLAGGGVLTPTEFAKTFQARAGSYEVLLRNPLTGKPERIRFTLPEGMPESVRVDGSSIRFDYGMRRFVRIEFDKEGAQVVSRY